MPLRLPLPPIRLAQQCHNSHATSFHTLSSLRADSTNFYELLEVSPNAPQAEIKKQFYALSKKYHPDLHPSDSAASQRFVSISTAYATIGNAAKRAKYDSENQPASARGAPSGSHSSAQSTWGARPASGLSKRRGTFRGPPPSFYRSGGWGAHGEKRRAAQESGTNAGSATGGAGPMGGGFAPGQGSQKGFDNDVPHFDRDDHLRRQEAEDERARVRRSRARARVDAEAEGDPGDMLFKTVAVTGAVGLAILATSIGSRSKEKKIAS